MAVKVSVINFKGGVGKTTIAFHLATYLARESKVLVVDVDHQSSLSIVMLGEICGRGQRLQDAPPIPSLSRFAIAKSQCLAAG